MISKPLFSNSLQKILGRIGGILFAVPALLSSPSCQEETPFVVGPSLTLDTTYVDPVIPTAQDRVVLLEDFTGVQCVNCPTAHSLAKSLSDSHPGQVVSVSEHNYFEGAFPNSDEDFRTDEAFAIDALIGPTTIWPIGTVNRVQFAAEPAVLLITSKWTGYVEEQLTEPPIVNVSLETNLDPVRRTLSIIVQAHFLETVSEATRISVMVLESGIVDPQQTNTGKQDDYVHNEVLRKMPTPATGELITNTTEVGRVIRKGYRVDLPSQWNLNELDVVAFIHLGEPDNKSVLQVAHAKP